MPPAPGWMVKIALLESYLPDRSVDISSFSMLFSSDSVSSNTSFISAYKSESFLIFSCSPYSKKLDYNSSAPAGISLISS